MQYKVGDLITALRQGEVSAIGHGCNCFNTMKSGIAPKIATAFPSAWIADQQTLKGDVFKLGTFSLGKASPGRFIFNLYSQFGFWGRTSNPPKMDLKYDALASSLRNMDNYLESYCNRYGKSPEDMPIGLPKIGAGLAGGDWKVIEKIISEEIVLFPVTIYVLKETDLGY